MFVLFMIHSKVTYSGRTPILKNIHTDNSHPNGLMQLILDSLDSDKAEEIQAIDLTGQTAIADYMVIASGRSSRQVAALAEKLQERIKAFGFGDSRIEGRELANWVIVDAGDVIVHLFRPEVREFYNLEGMWTAFAPTFELSSLPRL
jgi:ribosome-associated protein